MTDKDLQYALDNGKPVMSYPGDEDFGELYHQFYQQICGPEE